MHYRARTNLEVLCIVWSMASHFNFRFVTIAVLSLAWTSSSLAQSNEGPTSHRPTVSSQSASAEESAGNIRGTVIDPTGAVIAGAAVRLTGEKATAQTTSTDDQGHFGFSDVVSGPYMLTITAASFETQILSEFLHLGEIQELPAIMLNIAATRTTVQVGLPQVEVAEEQIQAQAKQRVLGVVPDFYVSFVPNAVPLNSRQKFELAWKTATDPFTLILAGGIAGVQQAQNYFGGYGQEIGGYARRYGANYADLVTSTFIGDAVLASALRQDPRYFYKGTGSKKSRAFYAIANAVICKGNNGHWQPNYSRVLGHLAAGGISNLYYPASDRHGVTLTFENASIGIGGSAAVNLFQEFVVRKFIPKAPKGDSIEP